MDEEVNMTKCKAVEENHHRKVMRLRLHENR